MSELYIGLMSGTSMDGVDAALVSINDDQIELLDFLTHPYPCQLKQNLELLCHPGANELHLSLEADQQVADVFAEATLQLLNKQNLSPDKVKAIGSHGQTIRHAPDAEHPYTLQIGDPNRIAAQTSIDTVADFRRKDIALGGQGAPLVPVPHAALFGHNKAANVLINVGGIANVSYLPARTGESKGQILGFDTGPGNTLMDLWCQRHLGHDYDANGAWAATGKVHQSLLQLCLTAPFFSQAFPKSTGREDFHLPWLESELAKINQAIAPEDVQATLLELTAQSIALGIAQLPQAANFYVCGGGAYNPELMASLGRKLVNVQTTQALSIAPDAVEAVCFAWLAYAHKHRIPGNLPSVTGASKPAILGALFPA